MMNIKANFNISNIEAIIKKETTEWFHNLLGDYQKAGKIFVDRLRARTKLTGSFANRTFDLRSSIGYLLLFEGKIVDSYFPKMKSGSQGTEIGLNYAKEIAGLVQEDGIQMVIVAGMEYALFVERKGYDVLSKSSKDFPKDLLTEFKR